MIVSPNVNADVIKASSAAGLASLPANATATEAFAAIDAGAHALKLFPAEAATPAVLRAPARGDSCVHPHFGGGGINAASFRPWQRQAHPASVLARRCIDQLSPPPISQRARAPW